MLEVRSGYPRVAVIGREQECFGGTGNVLFLELVLVTEMCSCCENSLIGALVICVGVFCVYVVCKQNSF